MPDLQRIKDDIGYLAHLLGQPLKDWQRLTLTTLFTCIVGARQMGKSRFAAILALWWAIREPGKVVILASASEDGARRLLAMARRYAKALPALEASFTADQLGLLTLSNGSEIRAIATSEGSARGWSADLVIVDESQLCPRSFIDAIVPTVTAREGARIVLLGTGSISEGAFYDVAKMGDAGVEEHRTLRWVSTIAGGSEVAEWIQPSVIEAARRTMSASRFGAEYRAEFASGGDVVFPLSLLERQTAEFACETENLANLRPFSRGSLGLDWGERADRSAGVRVEFFAGTRVLGISAVRRWKEGEGIPEVVKEIASSPGHFASIWPERNGLGGPSSQFLEKAFRDRSPLAGGGRRRPRYVSISFEDELRLARQPKRRPRPRHEPRPFRTPVNQIFTTASLKATGFGQTRLLLEEDRLRIPAGATDLRSELTHLRSALTQSGVERIEASWGNDDLCMALLMALQPVRDQASGAESWRLRLADQAEARAPARASMLPGVDLARLTADRVMTGAGAEVPRHPVWQSVSGTEVTLPDGVEFLPTEADERPAHLAAAREAVAAALATQKEAP